MDVAVQWMWVGCREPVRVLVARQWMWVRSCEPECIF